MHGLCKGQAVRKAGLGGVVVRDCRGHYMQGSAALVVEKDFQIPQLSHARLVAMLIPIISYP